MTTVMDAHQGALMLSLTGLSALLFVGGWAAFRLFERWPR